MRSAVVASLRDDKGITIVEFAIVAPCLVLLMIGLLDLGFKAYVGIQLQGALEQSARQVTVGTSTTTAALTSLVKTQIVKIVPKASVSVVPTSYYDFANVGKPEPITTDTAPLGTFNQGDCFQDLNGNGVWDADAGSSGTGGSEDIVYYTATVTYPDLLPAAKLFGFSSTATVTGTTMMKNQPYASQAEPAIKCT
ncbi:Flp pilus assembly protein TadG [Sphingomonas insulae]|uniref:TadE-like domain-containing protein n=1 Tax=Sphingomonas insulae TaxID=424800 RepID=A0ABN1HQ85_9SPHN|nr:TadE family protein [Sphingomonas insulae]NIJ29418.1 Flp pilus assembly protein TadG [Sphingomonas insulae]